MSETIIDGYTVKIENGILEISDTKYVMGFSRIGTMQLKKLIKEEL